MDNFTNLDPSKINAQIMELAAIWLSDSINVTRGDGIIKSHRITAGDKVAIFGNTLSENGAITHKIIRCMGNINNSVLFLTAEHLETMKLVTVNL